MTQIAEKLNLSMVRYNWVGFYLIERRPVTDALVLGPFSGTINSFREIPLNKGVCGAAASSGETILVSNVAADYRYISVDDSVRTELVVPVFAHGKVTGILDVNSLFENAFTLEDCQLCECAAEFAGRFIPQHGY